MSFCVSAISLVLQSQSATLFSSWGCGVHLFVHPWQDSPLSGHGGYYRMKHLCTHESLVYILLRNALAIPKLMYTCYGHHLVSCLLRRELTFNIYILNCHLVFKSRHSSFGILPSLALYVTSTEIVHAWDLPKVCCS